jgi:hypothetical protein
MSEVIAHLAMSLDGFIADPDDGCDELFFEPCGRLDAIQVSLSDPEVIEDRGVTHLRYHVRKES